MCWTLHILKMVKQFKSHKSFYKLPLNMLVFSCIFLCFFNYSVLFAYIFAKKMTARNFISSLIGHFLWIKFN